jgi:hypothetical protein
MGYADDLDKFFMEDNKHDKYVTRSDHQERVRIAMTTFKINEKKRLKKITPDVKSSPKKKSYQHIPKLFKNFRLMTANDIENSMRDIRRQIEEKYIGNNNR